MITKLKFHQSLLQSSVSHDPSEILLICSFGAQGTFLIIIMLKLILINLMHPRWITVLFSFSLYTTQEPNKDNVINTRITLDRYVHQVISTLIISNLNIPINYIATSHLADPVNLVSYSKNRSAIDPDFGKPKPKVWHESQSLLR